MPKHGIDQVCTRRTPVSVLGTEGGPSWAQALVSPRMSLNKVPSPYAITKNIIIRSMYDASARHPMIHVSPYMHGELSHGLNLSKSYKKKGVFTFPFANPFCGLFCNFFLLHNLSKHYSVWFMTPLLCNSSPISQNGGVAVLCPVAVLGTFPYCLHSPVFSQYPPLYKLSIYAFPHIGLFLHVGLTLFSFNTP